MTNTQEQVISELIQAVPACPRNQEAIKTTIAAYLDKYHQLLLQAGLARESEIPVEKASYRPGKSPVGSLIDKKA